MQSKTNSIISLSENQDSLPIEPLFPKNKPFFKSEEYLYLQQSHLLI